MSSIKSEVKSVIDRLPDNCTLEDIQYHIYVMQKINKGLDDLKDGKIIDNDEAEKRINEWFEN